MRFIRILMTFLLSAVGLSAPADTQAQSLQNAPIIFDVRISLPLEPEEPVYHDFYINAGVDAGFKKGMYVNVVRLVPVHDPVQNKQQGTLSIGVARLHVIHVERQLTVARLVSTFTDEERPTLEFEAVMIGDRIDPSSMTMESPNSKKKKVESKIEVKIETKPESKPEMKPEAKAEAVPDNLAETKAERVKPSLVKPEKASPESAVPDMVRVPIPAEATRAM